MLFWVSFFDHTGLGSFTAVLNLHTFMVIVMTVVVSETELLAIVCSCVHCSLLLDLFVKLKHYNIAYYYSLAINILCVSYFVPNPQSSDMRHAVAVNDVRSPSGISSLWQAVNSIRKPSYIWRFIQKFL